MTVTFVDNAGTAEARTSAITTVVADFFDGGPAIVNDTLTGTAGDDVYHGGGGNDNLSTAAGDDLVSGDAGDDTISTGAGDDTITFSGTNEGFDSVTGGANVDAIIALTNNTTIGLRAISTVETISSDGHTGVKILGSALNDVLNFTASPSRGSTRSMAAAATTPSPVRQATTPSSAGPVPTPSTVASVTTSSKVVPATTP